MRGFTMKLFVLCSVCVLSLSGAAYADVVTTDDGLVLEGDVDRLDNGWYRIKTEAGNVDLAPDRVKAHREGVGPRTAFLQKAAEVEATDVVGQYKLALEAEAAGLKDLADAAYRRVLAKESDHLAARRALGYEKVGTDWISAADAKRRKGLVLFDGRWMLPAEIEVASAKKPTARLAIPDDEIRAAKLIETLATGDDALRSAARLALAQTSDTVLVAAAKQALFHKTPEVRIEACRVLSDLGDESALRALIFSGARDAAPAVRREAVAAAQSFGHDDTAVPFVRALTAENPRIAANAAEALAQLKDERAAGYIVKRLSSHGSSTRNYVAFLNQVSYVRDYDVEIAQASNIANPDVATLLEGVILDVQVKGTSINKTWIEPILTKALSELVDVPLRSKDEALAWYAANANRLPDFPKKSKGRAPRRSGKGRVIGAVGSN